MLRKITIGIVAALSLSACNQSARVPDSTADAASLDLTLSTCTGAYPSYFQDPAFTKTGMWDNQDIINQPPPGWSGPVFRLSDAFSRAVPESRYPWEGYNPFDPSLNQAQKTAHAEKYIWSVMHYIQEGNIGNPDIANDWKFCNNTTRQWFHIPYQTYDPMSGREYIHGLTREAPVTFTLNGNTNVDTTVWAVGFYNPAAANGISKIWTGKPDPKIPTQNFHFNEGSVIGKLLFTTATPAQMPFLKNVPSWKANISDPTYCKCKGTDGKACTFKEETQQCPRQVRDVYLLQFDIAVKDSRSPIGWTYGTFVADGERKAQEKNPWNRISPLGLMWGNDTPPIGTGAINYPADSHTGLKQSAIFWDVADMLNQKTNAGHLGCNNRLNGPADNAKSSCLSCHQTASVPDKNNKTPAILYQFGGFNNSNGQCLTGKDPLNLAIDQVYFKTFNCAESFTGPSDIVPPPAYASGQNQWISTDFSLQVSISLTQWQEWNADKKKGLKLRMFDGVLPSRGEDTE
jgi:hypothetical protein